MKKTTLKILALVLIVSLMATIFTGCGKKVDSGTYSGKLSLLGQSWEVSYTFRGNKVEAESKITLFGQVQSETTSGTYEITENSDGTMEITLKFEKEVGPFKSETVTFEQGEDYIKLGGIKYEKE